MTEQPELRERIARAMCAEKNAVYGEPPCWKVEGPWPNPNCGDCTCHDLADAVLSALSPQPPQVAPEQAARIERLAEALREIRDERYSNPWDAVQIATAVLAELEKEEGK